MDSSTTPHDAPHDDARPGDPSDINQGSWLVRVSVANPYLVVVVCLMIVVLGYVTLTRIPVDILPSFKTPAVQVLTLYPGMPTEIMERDITNRIERWTGQSEGIARQESRSMMGVSIVKNFFRDDIDPNTAFSQVTSYAMSDLYYLPPGTIPPMVMLFDPSAPMPTALLAASSDVLDEKESYGLTYFNVRNMLSGSPGVIAPAVFGGKLRRIYAYLDPDKLQAYGLSLMDVQRAIEKNNLMIPTGNAKIGDVDYMVDMQNMVDHPEELNDIAVPLGIIGVLLILWATGTTLNVQSFMGVIFMIGIAVCNSVLLVEFANRLRNEQDLSLTEAAVEAGRIRLRPILMTAIAAVMGLVPLALHEGEAMMPLARAVIGGLTASTVLTIFVVPCLYVIVKSRGRAATA